MLRIVFNGGLSHEYRTTQPYITARGIVAGTLSALVMLKMEEGWYAVWSDDAVLRVPYWTFEAVVEEADSLGLEIIAPFGIICHEKLDQWSSRQLIEGSVNFYKGFVTLGETMFVLKPSGAQQLLDVQGKHFGVWLDILGFHYHSEFQNVGTCVHKYIEEHIHISGIVSTARSEDQFEGGLQYNPVFAEILNSKEI